MVSRQQGLAKHSFNLQGSAQAVSASLQQRLATSLVMATISIPVLAVPSLLVAPARAQTAGSTLVSLNFPPIPNRGAPTNTAGGGRRGTNCQVGQTPLTALMPYDNTGTTTLAQPTLFWYLPESTAKKAEFVLFDSDRKRLYTTEMFAPIKGGIVRLTLPASVSLQTKQNYTWRMALVCDENDRSSDILIRGGIQRIDASPELKAKLSRTKEPLKQAELYANAGVWSETLTIAAQLRASNPKAWEELLKSVNLVKIADAPFVN